MELLPDNQGRPGYLVARATALRILPASDPQKWGVVILCPYCGKEHSHRWRAPGGRLLTQRLAHCPRARRDFPGWVAEYSIDAAEAERASGFDFGAGGAT